MKLRTPLIILAIAVIATAGVIAYMHSPQTEANRTVALLGVRGAAVGAAFYADEHSGDFSGFCQQVTGTQKGIECNASASAWAVSKKISLFEHACIDSVSKDQSKPVIGFKSLGTGTVCP